METVTVMFFNWHDLWLAVTIILSFIPGGWRNQTGQLRPEGGGTDRGEWSRKKEPKERTRCRRVQTDFWDEGTQRTRYEGEKKEIKRCLNKCKDHNNELE